jgi:hypothetical protein
LSEAGANDRQRAKESLNGWLDFKNRKSSTRDDEAGIPRKLNGIAKPLFSVEEDALARERLAAPARTRKGAWNPMNFAELPSGFIGRPSAAPFAEAKLGEREVVSCA